VTDRDPDPDRPTPRTTVVIVTYHSRDHLPSCLEALDAAAAGEAIETVVVDNASGDGVVAYVRESRPEVRIVLNDANLGFAAAVNQGARMARGDALLLLNPDVVLEPRSLGRLRRALEDPRVGIVGPQLFFPDGSPQRSVWDAPSLRALAFEAFLLYNLFPRWSPISPRVPEAAEDVGALSGACLLVRRACFDTLGGLDERFFLYFEDVDLGLRARAAGWRVRLLPDARAVHHLGASAFRNRRAFWRHHEQSRRALLRKHLRGPRLFAAEALQAVGLAVRATVYALTGFLAADRPRRKDARHVAAALVALFTGPRGRVPREGER
jgi:GT2 family glycosyltransferase